MSNAKSLNAAGTLNVGDRAYPYFRLAAVEEAGLTKLARLPYSLKILLENLLRFEDGRSVTRADIEALARWNPKAASEKEIAFRPARVLLQDFTGVPCVVDLAAMRDAMATMGGNPKAINPLQPVELVIDHSVQVDYFGTNDAPQKNADLEFERNRERYAFLKWGQAALDGFRAVPPDTGIVHQVNIEYLARVVFGAGGAGIGYDPKNNVAYPDTAVGTDSHTTMVNGVGVLAWGVGGIEAEAAMLGQPVTMLIPEVIGFRLDGKLREGVTATDLVLKITEMLRRKGVVGKFVEFFGKGLSSLPVADRTTIGNMSPEFGSTVRDLPDRRSHARVSAPHRARRRTYRAGRSVRESARPLPYRRDAGCRVHRCRCISICRGRTESRRTAPSAGSRAAARREEDVQRRDGRMAGCTRP